VGSGYRLDGLFAGLDEVIPFVPEMVIFYSFLFYGMVILTMLYFAFVDNEKGYALGWSLVLIGVVALVFYIFFPVSTYWYRQQLLAHPIVGNFWADQVYDIFATDTSFNCFPSLHAAVSTICFYTWYRYSRVKVRLATKLVAAVTLILAGGIVLSTLFIKQHYIADEIAGVLLAWGAGRIIFNHLWKSFKVTELRADDPIAPSVSLQEGPLKAILLVYDT
jgi:membrane-associated phospholipid phosphatase